ncbi:MAG TPA: DUF4331 family protein [Acidobacteriaceae bacterium]|nr:DUF4331 family protein [Acidobacteriaceae bacterium]
MSHHFDTPTAREDPRINLCDLYLFEGSPGHTVMAMTVNPDAGLSSPETFRDEGLYAFRFDLNGDAREELTFKVRFGAVEHSNGDEHRHIQHFEVRQAVGADARKGAEGAVLATGETGGGVRDNGISVFAGLAPDLFAGDAAALRAFNTTLAKENRFDAEVWKNRKNFFAKRNVTAIVIELPTQMIGRGRIHAWATVSLYGHAPEVQVSRWGLPLITNVLIPDQDVREIYNRTGPAEDREKLGSVLSQFTARVSGLAGSTPNPAEYGQQVADRLCPIMLPYELGSQAAFDFAGFNGRALGDDVMDVMITLASNVALSDGVAPDRTRIRPDFPYFGPAFSAEEQAGIPPALKRSSAAERRP